MVSATRCVGSVRGDFARPPDPGFASCEQVEALTVALHDSHSREVAKLRMQLLKYRLALLDNGIEPPDADGDDLLRMWESCRAVMSAAHLAVAELGTSKELLVPFR